MNGHEKCAECGALKGLSVVHWRGICISMLSNEAPIKSDVSSRRERVKHLYASMIRSFEDRGGRVHARINAIDEVVPSGTVIVRREQPLKIFRALTGGEVLTIHPDVGHVYANAVEWKPSKGSRGLANAFTEGFGEYEGLVTVIGFRKSADMDISYPQGLEFYQPGLDRDLVRCVQGTMSMDDVRFVIFRVPIDRFPLEDMTFDEREKYEEWLESGHAIHKPLFIFRAVTFPDAEKKNDPFRGELAA